MWICIVLRYCISSIIQYGRPISGPDKQKSPGMAMPGLWALFHHAIERSSFDHFDNRLCLDHHLAFVEQVEALHEKLMRAALDVEHAKRRARIVAGGGLGGHQLALGSVADDLMLGGIVERLTQLLFLRA